MAMDFSPAEKTLLREKLLTALAPYTEADPDTLVEFILMFLTQTSEREELKATYQQELSALCEDNTDKAVEVLFGVFDEIIDKRNASKEEPVAGRKREKDESDDEDDDDRNFKRRNTEDVVADIPPMDVSSFTNRKSQDSTEEQPNRPGHDGDSQRFANLPEHLRKRLGGRADGSQEPQQRTRQPCRFFEERGYCLYGDNCKFDHGQDHIAVSDYSNFQAMFPGGSLPMTNPMMIGMTAPYNMTAQPYGFQNMGTQQPNLTQQPQWQQQQQQPRHNQQPQQSNASQNDVPYTTRYTKDSTRIVIEKVPIESCNIDSVTEAFKKFGTIVDIELQPENQRAFLEFKTHDEALKAHQSPEVLFNNRFVKVYWRKEERRQPYKPPTPDPELVKKKMEELAKIREENQRRKKEQLEKQIEYNKQKQEIARRNLELAMLKAKVAKMEEAKKKSAAAANENSDAK